MISNKITFNPPSPQDGPEDIKDALRAYLTNHHPLHAKLRGTFVAV